MSSTEIERHINALLAHDEQLANHWTAPPATYVDDTPDSPGSDIAVVWLCVGSKSMSRAVLWRAVQRVIEIATPIVGAARLRRIDVIPRFYDGSETPVRVVRIAVDVTASRAVASLDSTDIETSNPVLGIQCAWFIDPHQIAS